MILSLAVLNQLLMAITTDNRTKFYTRASVTPTEWHTGHIGESGENAQRHVDLETQIPELELVLEHVKAEVLEI